jgi:general secretion pathway protein I
MAARACRRPAANSAAITRSTLPMTFRTPPPDRRRMRGFSLIEMVAAFLVFAIGIGVLMQILATSMRNTRQSSDYTMAALWAESKLDGIGVGEPVEAGRSSGRFDRTYSWELDVQQVDPAAIEPPPQQQAGAVGVAQAGLGGGIEVMPFELYQVDLTVLWGGNGGRVRSAHFSTLRAVNPDPNNPQAGGPGRPQMPQMPGRR